MKKLVVLAIVSLLITLGVAYFVTRLNVQKQYVIYTEQITNAENNEKTFHDDMWKTIKTSFKVEESMKEDYQKAIDAYVARGESYQDAMFIWAKESNIPPPSEQLRIELINTVQDKNSEFSQYRKQLARVVAERNTYVRNPWKFIFLTRTQREIVEAKLITSTNTEKAFEIGTDDLEWLDNR